jgi:hypothetical protein
MSPCIPWVPCVPCVTFNLASPPCGNGEGIFELVWTVVKHIQHPDKFLGRSTWVAGSLLPPAEVILAHTKYRRHLATGEAQGAPKLD